MGSKPTGASTEADRWTTAGSREWWRAVVFLFLLAAALRLAVIDLKPLHHDEGVNAFFLKRLVDEGTFHYDPANYHGPTLPYAALVSVTILGMNTFALRLVPALFGLGSLVILLGFRREVGPIAAFFAAIMLAVSPGFVFHSRYFIHEMLLVFFTLGFVASMSRLLRGEGDWWILPAALSLGLMFATKETAIITVVVLLLAALLTGGFIRVMQPNRAAGTGPRWGVKRVAFLTFAGALIFLAVNVIFYSSFFSYMEGVRGAIRSFEIWKRTGEQAHVHPWYTYLQWLAREESPLLLMGAAATFLTVWSRASAFAFFCCLWAWGLVAAYSLVPYKTPWLTLNFLVPLALASGFALERMWDRLDRRAAATVAMIATLTALFQAVELNFYRYDDERLPYVYAPTNRDFIRMMSQIDQLSARAGSGWDTDIAVMYSSYWPMPWYLRDYRGVAYFGTPTPTEARLVIGATEVESSLEPMLGNRYVKVAKYVQRNGLYPILYARRDVVERPLNCP